MVQMFSFWFASTQQMEERHWRWKLSVCVCLCVYIIGVLADFTTLLKHCHFKTLARDAWMSEHADTRANLSSLPSHHRLKLGQELYILTNWPPFLYHVQGALINFITSQHGKSASYDHRQMCSAGSQVPVKEKLFADGKRLPCSMLLMLWNAEF